MQTIYNKLDIVVNITVCYSFKYDCHIPIRANCYIDTISS